MNFPPTSIDQAIKDAEKELQDEIEYLGKINPYTLTFGECIDKIQKKREWLNKLKKVSNAS